MSLKDDRINDHKEGIEKMLEVLRKGEVVEVRDLSEDEFTELREHYEKDRGGFHCGGGGVINSRPTYTLYVSKKP